MTLTSRPLRIGLTGGIGSGKSTVGKMLQSRGAAVIDSDAIARNLTTSNGIAIPAISQTFGSEFIDSTGALNRERMREVVFANPQAKIMLEAIIHPLVAQETEHQAQIAVDSGHTTLVFDVPLLVESSRWRPRLDRVIVVDCDSETQIQRVMDRNQLSREAILKIIANQASRLQRLKAADWVLHNEHISLNTLQQLVADLPIC